MDGADRHVDGWFDRISVFFSRGDLVLGSKGRRVAEEAAKPQDIGTGEIGDASRCVAAQVRSAGQI